MDSKLKIRSLPVYAVVALIFLLLASCSEDGDTFIISESPSPGPDEPSPTVGTSTTSDTILDELDPETIAHVVSREVGGAVASSDGKFELKIDPGILRLDTELKITRLNDTNDIYELIFEGNPFKIAQAYEIVPVDEFDPEEPFEVVFHIGSSELGFGGGFGRTPALSMLLFDRDTGEGTPVEDSRVDRDSVSGDFTVSGTIDRPGVILVTNAKAAIELEDLPEELIVGEQVAAQVSYDLISGERLEPGESISILGDASTSGGLGIDSIQFIEFDDATVEGSNFEVEINPGPTSGALQFIWIECKFPGPATLTVKGRAWFYTLQTFPTAEFQLTQDVECVDPATQMQITGLSPALTKGGYLMSITGRNFPGDPANIGVELMSPGGVVVEAEVVSANPGIIIIIVPELDVEVARSWQVVITDRSRLTRTDLISSASLLVSWPSIEGEWVYSGQVETCTRVGGQVECRTDMKTGRVTFHPARRFIPGDEASEPFEAQAVERDPDDPARNCMTNWTWQTNPDQDFYGKVQISPACAGPYYGTYSPDYNRIVATDDNGNTIRLERGGGGGGGGGQ